MRKIVAATLLLVCGIGGASLLNAQTPSQQTTAQQTPVQQPGHLKVFVSPLEGQDADVLGQSIRKKLIAGLEKHGVLVTESKQDAGLILSGSSLVQTTKKWTIQGLTSYCIRASMTLAYRDGTVLWDRDVASDRFAAGQASNFVDKVTQSVVEAISRGPKVNISEKH